MTQFQAKEDELYIDGQKVIGVWESFSGCYWFATKEIERGVFDLGNEEVEGITYHGLVQGLEEEWGDFCTAEFKEMIHKHQMWEVPRENWTISGRRN